MAFRTGRLANNETGQGYTHFAVFDWEGVNTYSTSAAQAKIAEIPANGAMSLVTVMPPVVSYAGATDITLDVGTTAGDPDEYIDALDVDGMSAAVSNTGDSFVQAAGNTTIEAGERPLYVSADTPVYAEWNGTTGDLTAGETLILMRIIDPYTDVRATS